MVVSTGTAKDSLGRSVGTVSQSIRVGRVATTYAIRFRGLVFLLSNYFFLTMLYSVCLHYYYRTKEKR